ncbi:MAG: hypothetical protein VB051_02985 [Candidatus Pelethousia sp.]|nr:hypothetical protein [Candidatus Pelethousia sp.]
MMHKRRPDAGQEWNRFSQTGHPADYLAYRASRSRQPRGSKPPGDHS